MNKSKTEQLSPWDYIWPPGELESVPVCPVCLSSEFNSLYDELVDDVFFVAPGIWKLKTCIRCASACLDPRPNLESMGKAYGNYYTHKTGTAQTELAHLGILRLARRVFANGYLNFKYGLKRRPSIMFGVWLLHFLPRLTSVLDAQYRFLPKPFDGQCLLDVGCGNGDFLVNAKEVGWIALGIEPDVEAAKTAKKRDCDVIIGDIDCLERCSNKYDVITISHVIEHVHEPRNFLKSVKRLLKEGGLVYIDTPNISSYGAKTFKKNWRGIEAPRHLVLFNHSSLEHLLKECGFVDVEIKRRMDVQKGMYYSSKKLSNNSKQNISIFSLINILLMRMPFVKTNKLEFVTLTARKSAM
jgi:2-polyprenyl-3-methyl-5-hydroxy-6-metoxy-1,4-benzoquinol methylase